MSQVPRRIWILLAELLILYPVALTAALRSLPASSALEMVCILVALSGGRLLVSPQRGRQLFAFAGSLLAGVLTLGVALSEASVGDSVAFGAAALSLVVVLLVMEPTSGVSTRTLLLLGTPAVLFLPLLHQPFWVVAVTSAISAVLALSSTYTSKPLLAERPDVRDAYALHEPTTRPSVELSVVLPAYNVAERLGSTIERLRTALVDTSLEIIVVDDGSSDTAVERLTPADDLVVLRKRNGGKGSAIAAGVLAAHGERIAFLDADGDIDPLHLAEFLSEARSSGVALVVGSKRARGARNDSSALRRAWSWGFQTLQQTLLPTGVADSQVGAKLADADLMRDAVSVSRENRFLFDVELLCYATSTGQVVREMPVSIRRDGSSSVSMKTAVRMLFGVLAITCARLTTSREEFLDAKSVTDTSALHA